MTILLNGSFLGDISQIVIGLFIFLTILCVYRVFDGPTMQDRVIAVNVIGTNIVIIISLIAGFLNRPTFLDIAIVYALLNFLMSIAISKFTVERGGVI